MNAIRPALLAPLTAALLACGGDPTGRPTTCPPDCPVTPPGIWTAHAEMPSPRQEMPAVMIGGRVYVPGGIGPGGQVLSTMAVYDLATDAWSEGPAMPAPRHHHAGVSAGGRLYVIGGYSGLQPPWPATSTVWEFDPATQAWRERAGLPAALGAAAVAEHGGEIYLFGGANGPALATVYVYDPAADAWTARAPMPTAREHVAAVTVGSTLVVIGGRAPHTGDLSNIPAVEACSPATDTWDSRAPMPLARSGHAAAALGGRVYVFGGEREGGVFNTAAEYDPVANAWRPVTSMPQARTGLAAVTVGGRIHVIGGAGAPNAGTLNLAFSVPAED